MRAFDSAYPTIYCEDSVILAVQRNLAGPSANSVSITIPATTDINAWSFYVNATDPDSVSILCMNYLKKKKEIEKLKEIDFLR